MRVIIGGQKIEEKTADISPVIKALKQLFQESYDLSLAVSYIQLSGWREIKSALDDFDYSSIRIICTDQMGITDPDALIEIMQDGVQLKRFKGNKIFHPKVYISCAENGEYTVLCGSSNISASALNHSVECNVLFEDKNKELIAWFDDLFKNGAEEFTDEHIDILRVQHKKRQTRRISETRKLSRSAIDNIDIEDNIFQQVSHNLGLLNFDHTGNTIRTLHRAKEVLQSGEIEGKNKSELGGLGLVTNDRINDLGIMFRDADSLKESAEIWIEWLYHSTEKELIEINSFGRLNWAKQAHENFSRMHIDIKNFFLENCIKPSRTNKKLLQTIEICSNITGISRYLNMDDAVELSEHLEDINVDDKITEYLLNKGTRSWKFEDRKLLIKAWEKVSTQNTRT